MIAIPKKDYIVFETKRGHESPIVTVTSNILDWIPDNDYDSDQEYTLEDIEGLNENLVEIIPMDDEQAVFDRIKELRYLSSQIEALDSCFTYGPSDILSDFFKTIYKEDKNIIDLCVDVFFNSSNSTTPVKGIEEVIAALKDEDTLEELELDEVDRESIITIDKNLKQIGN